MERAEIFTYILIRLYHLFAEQDDLNPVTLYIYSSGRFSSYTYTPHVSLAIERVSCVYTEPSIRLTYKHSFVVDSTCSSAGREPQISVCRKPVR